MKPSREGVLAAFIDLYQLLTTSGFSTGIYDNTAAGVAGTTNGQIFLVKGDGTNTFVKMYKNNVGVAQDLGISLPSSASVQALFEEAIAEAQAAAALTANITATSGEKLPETSVLTGTSGGAIPIIVGGRTIGFTVPIGEDGAGSNLILRIPFSFDEAQRLAGSTIRLRVVMEATAGYLAATPFGGNAVRVDRQNGTTDMNVGAALAAGQSGTRLTRDYTYTMVGDELWVGATVQIGANSPTGAVRSFRVKSIVWDVIATPATAGATGTDAALDARLAALEPAADIFGKVEAIFQFFNDAVAAKDDGGRTVGSTIPAGKSGQNTIMQWRLPMTGRLRKMLPGRQARLTLGFNTPTGWARSHTVNMQVRDVNLATTAIVATEVIDKQISPTRRVISFNFQAPTGMTLDDLRPYIALTDASNAGTAETITLTDMVMSYYRNGSDVMQEAASTALLGDEITRGASVEQAVGTVFATGKRLGAILDAASYASIALALQTATALASPGAMAQVNVGEGVFTERSLGLIGSGTDGDNVILRGAGKCRTIIDARLPATTPIATIQATSGFDFNKSQEVSDATLWVGNMRYGAHIDSVNFAPDSRNVWRNVDIVHFGNDAADAYWGQSVWASQHAWALGTTSGSYYGFDNCGGRAPRAAFSAHDQIGFTSPSIVEWIGGSLTATNVAGWCFRLESIGSMIMNRALLSNATLSGDITMAVQPWLPTTLDMQPADHRCWELVGYGNSPAVFRIEDFGRALRITSATTGATSKVVLSGTAAPILCGKTGTAGVIRVDGDIGMAGYSYGWGDISSDITSGRPGAITKLGARLGNRTGAPITLTVQVDGFAAVDIVFSANYTAMTNADILAIINTALTGKAVASEYNVGARYRPFIADEEASLLNSGGTMIFMGMALAFTDDSHRAVRPMLNTDRFSTFAGIAWEDIRPGAFGRVKTAGWIDRSDVLRADGGVIDVGERFTIDAAKPGYVRSGEMNGIGLLECVRNISGQDLTTLSIARGVDALDLPATVQGTRVPLTYGMEPAQIDANGLSSLIMTPDGLDGHFARPGSQRAPLSGGRSAIVVDQDGAFPIGRDEQGRLILGALAVEPSVRMPFTNGHRPNLMTDGGLSLRGEYDGVIYDAGVEGQVVPDPAGETLLGRKQAAVFEIDPGTLWPTRRGVTLSQQGDFTPLGIVSPGLMRVKGPDVDYPIGVVGWREQVSSPNALYIIIKHGQSNSIGITQAADGSAPNPKFTELAPLPGQCLTFNAGPHPHQSSGGSGDVANPADPSRFTSFIDMVVGEYEGSGLGAAEVFAMASGAKVLLINNGFSGSSFAALVGSAGSDAQPWSDIRAMVNSAVSIAAGMGLTPVIAGLIFNWGENGDSSGVAGIQANFDVLRGKVDLLAPLTGQVSGIPIVAAQPASTQGTDTGLVRPAALAVGNWASIASNRAVAMPLYWTSMDDVATVHHRAQGHRHIDELSGHLLWEFATNSRARTPRMVSARRSGTMVTVTMSEPVTDDTKGVADPGSLGISYRDSTASRTVSGVKVDGNVITFRVTGATGAGEVVSIGCIGAKKYPALSNRDGMGRLYGLRSCIRSLRKYWSHTTGRPLFLWAQQQELNVTVSA
ncbi:hypothetical protein [Sphingobium sp. WCS2017Hpa-17]|uniref:hypothetical protein n=1 Tax=Sphingobium sp. WCS2017Hpa-17 TaxID=3073638 RepID=UPI0028898106|nr:hypothetical protein [Sphingobium sp. WCS2017Hpa-17]